MARDAGCHPKHDTTPHAGDSGAQWDSAARRIDEVAAALFEGDYLTALRLAKLAARKLEALADKAPLPEALGGDAEAK